VTHPKNLRGRPSAAPEMLWGNARHRVNRRKSRHCEDP
jgi:hypothetical protein